MGAATPPGDTAETAITAGTGTGSAGSAGSVYAPCGERLPAL